MKRVKKYWFMGGLVLLFLITLVDSPGVATAPGIWLKAHHGPPVVIFLIFLFSGMLLNVRQVKDGITDVKGIGAALFVIFVAAPAISVFIVFLPVHFQLKIGLFLVAVMPTTLSSGVVMTGTAGGNIAHALLITVIANGLCAVTIPVTLAGLLQLVGSKATVVIDQAAIMQKLVVLALLPLIIGMTVKYLAGRRLAKIDKILNFINQCNILLLVFMALSASRTAIVGSLNMMGLIFLISFVFHGLLLGAAALTARLLHIGRGRRESLLFMGGQKTLTLAVVLQVTLFPDYGLVLTVSVLHHIVHLIMDGYLAGRLAPQAESA
jgi:sodium/bile acid cotransporter 7